MFKGDRRLLLFLAGGLFTEMIGLFLIKKIVTIDF